MKTALTMERYLIISKDDMKLIESNPNPYLIIKMLIVLYNFKVIHRTHTLHLAEELHHTGWNACSSCHDDPKRSRNRLIAPGILSNRIYVIDVETNPRKPKIDKVCINLLVTLR